MTNPKDVFAHLTKVFADIHRRHDLLEKEFENEIDKIRMEVGDEDWDAFFKAAVFLAVKQAEARKSGSCLILEDEDDS